MGKMTLFHENCRKFTKKWSIFSQNQAKLSQNEAQMRPKWGPNEVPMRSQWVPQWCHSGLQWVPQWVTVGKCSVGPARTHATGTAPGPHHATVPHVPGTHHPGHHVHMAPARPPTLPGWFTRLLLITVRQSKYQLVQNSHFLTPLMTPLVTPLATPLVLLAKVSKNPI